MRTNAVRKASGVTTFEGAPAFVPKASVQLERQVANCMLWEDTFYQSGDEIAKEILDSASKVPVEEIARLALRARKDYKLRHAPLLLVAALNKRRLECPPGLLPATVATVVQRADELAELLAVLQKVEGNKSLKKIMSHGIAKGLALAFGKFDAYQLAKYNRDNAIKLRDVLFLVHAKPVGEQVQLWKQLIDDKLPIPDTWETELSAGKDKKETFERLLQERKIGYMALLRNLRNMEQAGVDRDLVEHALAAGKGRDRVLPFRFIKAAQYAPSFSQAISDSMCAMLEREQKLPGQTLILVDVSGSMMDKLSAKSELQRWEAAAGLAVLVREIADRCRVYTFADTLTEVRNWRGLPLITGIGSRVGGGTALMKSVQDALRTNPNADRIIVVTDEQANSEGSRLPAVTNGYLLNVASYRPALQTSSGWRRISGFSERVVDWIRIEEGLGQA